MFFTTKPAGSAARVKPSLHKPHWTVFSGVWKTSMRCLMLRNGQRHVIEERSKLNPENAGRIPLVTCAKFSRNLNHASRTKKIHTRRNGGIPSQKITQEMEKYFSGKYHVKFWHFFVNFSCIYFLAKMACPVVPRS